MTIKTFGLFIVLVSVASGLTGCKSDEGEWIEIPNFEHRNVDDHLPSNHYSPSNQKELDRNAWRTYRSAMSTEGERSEKDLKTYLSQTAQDLYMDPKEVDDLTYAPDATERELIVNHVSRVRDAVNELQNIITNRREVLQGFEAKVKEARDLCATTTSWFCRSTDPEFMTTCEGHQENDTCRIASRLREERLLLEKNVEDFQNLLRALERRMKRIDGAGAKTIDA